VSNPFRPVAPASSSFLPEDYIARKTESRVNIMILTLFMLVMAGVVGAFLVTHKRGRLVRERQMLVNEQFVAEGKKIEQIRALENQRAQMMEKAEITAALLERVPRWAVLGEVTLRKPMSTTLDSLVIKSTRKEPPPPPAPTQKPPPVVKSLADKVKGAPPPAPERPKVTAPIFTYAMTITGSADNNTEIADFLASLKKSPIFDNVELTFIKEAKEKEKVYRKFEITASIRTDTDTQVLAQSLQKLKADRTALLEGRTPETAPAVTEVPQTQEAH
jgi:Tfp pilus assembly protein PilN